MLRCARALIGLHYRLACTMSWCVVKVDYCFATAAQRRHGDRTCIYSDLSFPDMRLFAHAEHAYVENASIFRTDFWPLQRRGIAVDPSLRWASSCQFL